MRKTQAMLAAEENDDASKEKMLGELIFFSSRALLITRGLEAKSEEEVYSGFLKHFIEAGLIAQSFREIVAAALAKDFQDISARQAEALELAKAVLALYETMDNTFNFKSEAPAQGSGQKADLPAVVKDFRGVACPLNFVKTKVELAKFSSGDLLEIWLDDGAPIENVPGSVKAEGHKIVAQNKLGDHWTVVIEKN